MLADKILLDEKAEGVIRLLTNSSFNTNTKKSNVCLHDAEGIFASIHNATSSMRYALEAFIKNSYLRVHSAHIEHFLPEIMVLSNSNGTLLAACGLRSASAESLFLERYLPSTVEQVLSEHLGIKVSRNGITEVGNLAITKPENIRCLLACINLYLHETETEWVVFTGIRTLKNALLKLNTPLLSLGKAYIDQIPLNERVSWGKYYEQKPEVFAIKRTTKIS